MRKIIMCLLPFGLILFFGMARAATDDIIVRDVTVQDGEVAQYYGYNSLTAGPNFVMEPGSNVSLRSRGKVIMAPGFNAKTGSQLLIEFVDAETSVPTISISASPKMVQAGETATLFWETANADGVTITPGIGSVGASGSLLISPSNQRNVYTISASNAGGTVTAQTIVYVLIIPSESLDLDHDGLPDQWQLANMASYSSGNCTTCGPEGDYDSDGINNYQEYILGWDPATPNTQTGDGSFSSGIEYRYDELGRIQRIRQLPEFGN